MGGVPLILVDDQPEVIERLRVALEGEFEIVGTAHSGEELLRRAPELEPQIIVLDVSMPGMSGIEAAERVTRSLPTVKIVILSMHSDPLYVTEALNAGASAYVLKTLGVSELVTALREVQNGNEYLSPSLRSGR